MGNQIFFHPLLLRVRPVWQAHNASLNSQHIRIIGGLFVKQVRINISPHIICHTVVVVDPTPSLRASSSDAESMFETVTSFDSEGVAKRRLANVPHHCVMRILLYSEGVVKCAWCSTHTKGVAKSIRCSSYTEDMTHAIRSSSHPKDVATKSVVSPYSQGVLAHHPWGAFCYVFSFSSFIVIVTIKVVSENVKSFSQSLQKSLPLEKGCVPRQYSSSSALQFT